MDSSSLIKWWVFASPFWAASPLLAQEQTQADAEPGLGVYQSPVPIARAAPTYPAEAQVDGREGWVSVSYIVSPEGKVTEPMIEDSSGVHELEKAALRAVRNWRYKPATLNGQPVEQSMTRTMIYFEIPGLPKGANPKFAATFKKAQDLVKNGELEQAKAMLDDLESKGRLNLYEDSFFWWLKYEYVSAAGGASLEEQRDILKRAIGFDPPYLAPDTFLVGIVQLFTVQVRLQDYAAALSIFERLKGSKEAKKSKNYAAAMQALGKTAGEINDLVDSDAMLKFDGRIGRFDYFVHGLLRRQFTITDINGQVDTVEIRCTRRNARYESVTREYTWTIPASWGTCGAYVKGTLGTTFALYEHPKAK